MLYLMFTSIIQMLRSLSQKIDYFVQILNSCQGRFATLIFFFLTFLREDVQGTLSVQQGQKMNENNLKLSI